MNIKKELIIGVIGSLFLIILVFTNINKYKNRSLNLLNNSNINITSSPVTISTQTGDLTLTSEEVLKNNNASDCWIIVNNSVYEVTKYLSLHPGGADRITPFCGKDATVAYDNKDGRGTHSATANQDLFSLKIGNLNQVVKLQDVQNTINNNVNQLNSTGSGREREYEDD